MTQPPITPLATWEVELTLKCLCYSLDGIRMDPGSPQDVGDDVEALIVKFKTILEQRPCDCPSCQAKHRKAKVPKGCIEVPTPMVAWYGPGGVA